MDDQTADRSRLYLNFDGVRLTALEMDVYADHLDPENDGVKVCPLFAHRSDREWIIFHIIRRVQADLDPFGLVVEPHWGNTVQNVGATTIYVGPTTYTNLTNFKHVASSIDIGNDNPTDIAFVSEESWGGDVDDVVAAMSDLILHEAGHTYGLHHVNVVENGMIHNETMGLRNSTNPSEWTRDTGFLNRTFLEYSNHGGGFGP